MFGSNATLKFSVCFPWPEIVINALFFFAVICQITPKQTEQDQNVVTVAQHLAQLKISLPTANYACHATT